MDERARRRRPALRGDDEALPEEDRHLSAALTALYNPEDNNQGRWRAGLARSAPSVARGMGGILECFAAPVVQIIQRDAFTRLGLKQMLLEPELLSAAEADVNLVADLLTLRGVMPEKTKQTAREVIAKVVAKLMERLERCTAKALRGAVDRSKRTFRPRFNDMDWPRTNRADLRAYQAEHRTVVPERLIGFMRRQRRLVDLDEVVLCIDQSGSIVPSVIYASIFAAIMASLPVVQTKLVRSDTTILDLIDQLLGCGRGAVRRVAGRRHGYQPGGRLLQGTRRAADQFASGADHRSL
ncbi:MAG: VWA domain-containing protein [Pseudomonadota bacterium]